jgi:hypothetical protein
MKKLLAFFAVAALSIPAAFAQGRYEGPITLSSAAIVAATATSNYTATVDVRGANYISILTQTTLSGAGTDDIVFKFSKSLDGTTFETTPSVSITNVSNGTTAVKKVSVVDVTGIKTLQLTSALNNSASRVLTNTVQVGVKNVR